MLRKRPYSYGDEATCFSDHGDFANIRRAQPDRRVGHPPQHSQTCLPKCLH